MKQCVQCNGKSFEKVRVPYFVSVSTSTEAEVSIPGLQCNKCKETYTEGADMERAEFLVARHVADSGSVNGETFRFMRRALGKQSNELAEQLGVQPETITRWEKGTLPTPPLAWAALALLVADRADGRETAKKTLSAVRHPTPLPQHMKVA